MPHTRKVLATLAVVLGLMPVGTSRLVHGSTPCGASFDGQCVLPPWPEEEQAAVDAGIYTGLPVFPFDTGIGGVNQFAGASIAMLKQYKAKLQSLAETAAAFPAAAASSGASTASSTCGPDGCPPSSAGIQEGAMIEPDGYCGPTSASNAVYALNLDSTYSNQSEIYAIAADMTQWDPNLSGGSSGHGSYDSNIGIDRGGYDRAHGRWYGEEAINDYSNSGPHSNYYTWENINAAGDVWKYTVSDIWGDVAPIYNISSEWYDGHHTQWPLPQYPQSYYYRPIYHYFAAYGYYGGNQIQIFDENNFLSQHFWVDNSQQLFEASLGNGQGTNSSAQILW